MDKIFGKYSVAKYGLVGGREEYCFPMNMNMRVLLLSRRMILDSFRLLTWMTTWQIQYCPTRQRSHFWYDKSFVQKMFRV